jgi:hypothetical protein
MDNSGAGGGLAVILALSCVLAVFLITAIGWWKLFEKAGQPGILAFIPIVNVLIYCSIAGNMLYFILLIIPVVNVFGLIYVHFKIAQAFGQGVLFALGLTFFLPAFAIILGFGDYRYEGKPI